MIIASQYISDCLWAIGDDTNLLRISSYNLGPPTSRRSRRAASCVPTPDRVRECSFDYICIFAYSLSSTVPPLYDVIPPSRSSTLSGLHPSAVTPHDVAGDLRTVAARFVSGCFSRPPGAIHVVISIPGHPPCPLDTTLNRTLLPPPWTEALST